MKKLLTVVGARPQFVKAAVLSRAIVRSGAAVEVPLHTGQHFDDNMDGVFYRELAMPKPVYRLEINGGTDGRMTGRMLEAVEAVLIKDRPDAVIVFGDTNTTLAGALAAAKLAIPLVHVEAGLRSFNQRMPEEINRVLTDHLSQLNLCSTHLSVENLRLERITRNVFHVGDIMYDATLDMRPVALAKSTAMKDLGLTPGEYCLATVHRQENTATPELLRAALAGIREIAGARDVALPLHPRTRAAAAAGGIDIADYGFIITEPLGYLDTQALVATAHIVITDSGGLQKEAYFHGVPCVTLRTETEWVETIEHGWNRLWSVPGYEPRRPITEYGDGHCGDEIMRRIIAFLDEDQAASMSSSST